MKYFYLILSLFLIIMISVGSIVAVDPSTLSNLSNINNSQDNAVVISNNAHDNNSSMQNQNNINSDNQSILNDNELNTTSTDNGGIRNISLTNGYNGYCINMSLHGAESNQEFTISNTSNIYNHRYGTQVGEYIKILFYKYWDIVKLNKDDTSEYVWTFTDRYYLTSNDTVVQNVISDYNNGLRVPDHGAVKKINDTSGMVFDFICLISGSDTIQNYFGYKVTIQNITQNNTTDFNNTTVDNTTNSTNNTNITNSTNNNTDNSNNITNSTNGNDTNSTLNNNTLVNNQNNKTGTGLYNTGNPLYILFAALMLLTALPFYRKK